MGALSQNIRAFHLRSNDRTRDESLKSFLSTIRVSQPPGSTISEFFRHRVMFGDLTKAVRFTIFEGIRHHYRFTWLCVTQRDQKISLAALACLKHDPVRPSMQLGYPEDSPRPPHPPLVSASDIVLKVYVSASLVTLTSRAAS